MKKILAIVAVMMLVPFTAFGMEMMADTALEDVTGQAGVSITIDNVQMDFAMDYLSWGDGDGLGGSTEGYVNLTQIQMTGIVIDKLIVGSSQVGTVAGTTYADHDGDASTPDVAVLTNTQIMEAGTFRTFDFNPYDGESDLAYLTIDVGDLTVAYDSLGNALTDTAVRIGIPTLAIHVEAIAPFDIVLDEDPGNDPLSTTAATLGSIAVGGMHCDLKGGTVWIFAH
jgi:hypothetical protein